MKIRTGFVSNSSSSSFVLIVDKMLWTEQIKGLTKDQKTTVKIFCSNKDEFNNMLIFSWMTGDMGENIYEELESAFTDKDDEGEDGEKSSEMSEWFDEFIGKLEKNNKDKVKTISVDC